MDWPKGGDIQVRLRMKQDSFVLERRCREGIIWIAELPEPITPMRLFVKS
jgi:hypothetical protein